MQLLPAVTRLANPARTVETPRKSLVPAVMAGAEDSEAAFDLTNLRIFTSVPDHPDFGIVALRGMVVVYDERPLQQEGVVEGAFYVREGQRPRSGLTWQTWLNLESARRNDVGPAAPLAIRREVVKAIHWPHAERWSVRLASGHVDGPYDDATFGSDFIGKVVGIYLPTTAERE